jgi:hypothetical protein
VNPSVNAATALPPYHVRTHNPSAESENRMHSDEVARRYGFRGGLVPGVTVFGHMTRPVVAHFGPAWLAGGWAEVSFGKPAYEGELLSVRATLLDGGAGAGLELTCSNEAGVELARMQAGMTRPAIEPDERASVAPSPARAERPEATWDLMQIGVPFPALPWQPSARENVAWCDDVRDDLSVYREGHAPFLHPGLVLRQANNVLKNRFVLPAWIHTASRVTFHESPRVGPAYEVRAIPEEKWVRKGHEFVRLYVAIRTGERIVAEMLHTAIFRPRQSGISE